MIEVYTTKLGNQYRVPSELMDKLREAEKTIETIAMYARINHDKPKDYGEIAADYIDKNMSDSKEKRDK